MSEHTAEPDPHAQRLQELGAEDSARQRQLAGLARGREKVAQAIALQNQMAGEPSLRAQVQAMALEAMPAIMRNMIRIAKGEGKGKSPPPPASAQVQATQLVAGAAGVMLEAQPGAGAMPLSEMTLGELDATLQAMRETIANAQAIESTAHQLPNQGSNAMDDGSSEPLAGQAEPVDPRPTPPRESG